MALNADRGFDISGVLTLNDVAFFTGPDFPWVIPLENAPINSIYIKSDGNIFLKTGAGDDPADWTLKIFATNAAQIKEVIEAGEEITIIPRHQVIVANCYEIELTGCLTIQAGGTLGVL